jgi:hypothetical protein
MSDSVRFSMPIKKARPRGARLIEGLSSKLGRRVSCHSRAAFELWLGAEADPDIQTFCERPVVIEVGGRERTIDLWVRHADHEALLLVADEDSAPPAEWNGIEVRRVGGADLAASRTWIANWEHMLPVINLTRDCVTKQHLADVRRYVRELMPLARIEREFVTNDAMWVRGAVFRLLAAGRLIAPSLRTDRLSLQTCFEPAP